MTRIDPNEVERVLMDCLFRDEEIVDGKPPENAVIVEGIMNRFALQPERLSGYRSLVSSWLRLLPHEFREKSGGGWTFLNACNQQDGHQWTGLHLRMDQLFCLAIGLGLAKSQMPREMWNMLPGGMPYFSISVEDAPETEGRAA